MSCGRSTELTRELLGKHGHYGKNGDSGRVCHGNANCTHVASATRNVSISDRQGIRPDQSFVTNLPITLGQRGRGFTSGMPPDRFPHDRFGPSVEAHAGRFCCHYPRHGEGQAIFEHDTAGTSFPGGLPATWRRANRSGPPYVVPCLVRCQRNYDLWRIACPTGTSDGGSSS